MRLVGRHTHTQTDTAVGSKLCLLAHTHTGPAAAVSEDQGCCWSDNTNSSSSRSGTLVPVVPLFLLPGGKVGALP